MNITNTAIPDVRIVVPAVFRNGEGFFPETFDLDAFRKALGKPVGFAEEIQTHTGRHELIGLRYQMPPCVQARLVHVVNGQVFHVAVDLRKSSPTFSRWVGTVLSDENGYRFWIPEGFASGLVTLSDFADIVAQTTRPYCKASERCIRWDDPAVAIDWHGIIAPRVSECDLKGRLLDEADVFA
ncbi:dTDP-4-dehydrorhamnose 3,5-epimerase [Oxalobacter paraformigenes]|uniref:dTDP-4-dehydrorhamnose 3,5-epimerase n=1 Tax=Oxalobacter paraformigenes TaxID=556268 RepID=C3X2Z4_9BURK|nr:dTDP-4-dehydrorhamnose 3,5-epimerase [Oxalobacter paraformigenes]EEO27580.1 dTDP-4-dehydrorhamnose 3,5-epimerase [Oxalobacter paraformigenes]